MRPGIAVILLLLCLNVPAFAKGGQSYGEKKHNSEVLVADTIKKDRPKKVNGCTTIANLTGNTCIGSTLIATANEPIASVEWFYEDATTRVRQTVDKQTAKPSYTFKVDAAGGYSVEVVTTAGCVVTSNAISVTNLLTPVMDISTKSNVVCAEFPVPVFTGRGTYNGEHGTFQWKVNNVNAAPLMYDAVQPFSMQGLKKGDRVTCEMTSTATCITTATVMSNEIIIDDIPVDNPTVRVEMKTLKPCSGASLSFEAIATHAGDSPAYQWFVNENAVPNTNSSSFASAQLKSGDRVTCHIVSNAQLCQVTNTAVSNLFPVVIVPSVVPAVSIEASITTAQAGSQISFTATTQNEGPHPVYRWRVNNVDESSTGPVFTSAGLKNGDEVTCTLISDADCTTSNTAVSNSIEVEITAKVQVVIPNAFTPNGDGINDTWMISGTEDFETVKVLIYNRYGQAVFAANSTAQPWAGTDNKGKPCPEGVYYYVISPMGSKAMAGSVTILK